MHNLNGPYATYSEVSHGLFHNAIEHNTIAHTLFKADAPAANLDISVFELNYKKTT